jgi:E3 ubiquitin-protein ligase listerin
VQRISTGRYVSAAGILDPDSSGDGAAGELSIKASLGTREVTATYEIDDANLTLVVKLPVAYPLAPAELECARRVGISEGRLRKWMLTISAILRDQNGAVAEGLLLWRRNVDKEFAGVEPCPICYLVIHGASHQTPRLCCRQCGNKFHSACLYKWFTSSSKSTCPLCQTPWGASYRG